MADSSKPRRGLAARVIRQVSEQVARVTGAVETAIGRPPGPARQPGSLSRIPEVLRDLRSSHLPEAAALLADLVPRSLQASQVAAAQLPALLRYDDSQVLSLYHAIIVAVLAQEKDAGPLLARTLPERLEKVDAAERRRFLSRVLRGAYVDWNLALVLAENLPELLAGLNDDALDTFLRRGFSLWRENPDKALSFFRLESRLGQSEVEALRHTLPLANVRRTLQMYAQAHGGGHIRVRSLEDLPSDLVPSLRSTAFTDGRNIYLPTEASGYATQEENFRLFKAMTAIEAGRIEFGTFGPPLEDHGRHGADPVPRGADTLMATLDALPHPDVATDLFELLETYRVESRIRGEYPGLVTDLERLAREGLMNRPHAAELEPIDAVLELFAQTLWGAKLRPEAIPSKLAPLLRRLEALAARLTNPASVVEDSLTCTREGLGILGALLPPEPMRPQERPGEDGKQQPQERQDRQGNEGGGQSASPGTPRSGLEGAQRARRGVPDGYRPFEPLPHHGRMWLDLAQQLQQQAKDERDADEAGGEEDVGAAPARENAPERTTTEGRSMAASGDPASEPPSAPMSPFDREGGMTSFPQELKGAELAPKASIFTYPEWDWQIDDYKDGWCLVHEERLPLGMSQFAEETLASHGPIVARLKRQFQKIRREEFEKLRRMPDGDEIDIDAVIEATVDIHGHRPPSERLYIQRQKRIRDVAVAFLVDMSSSTQQVVQASGKTILDIEKESLLLMAEALEALGDSYAIYGFSGYGRNRVSYFTAKEFSERYGPEVRQRIGGMSGRLENRDGAAIRHTMRKLLAQPARVRLLILLSDGRPLDCGCRQYFEKYAQEDTRMALREARRQRIHPFCITVDRQAQRYLSRMYGQVQYTIIDQVSSLPHRLPNIYRRLTT